jgi:hypothetical protein
MKDKWEVKARQLIKTATEAVKRNQIQEALDKLHAARSYVTLLEKQYQTSKSRKTDGK